MTPTRRFWLLIALGIPLALLGGLAPGLEWLLVPYNFVLFGALWITARLYRGLDDVRFERRFDPILSVRIPSRVELRLANDGPQPARLWVRDEPPEHCQATGGEFEIELAPFTEQERAYAIFPSERGEHPFRGLFVRALAPMGLVWVERRYPLEQAARVYPNVQAVREFDLLEQKGRLNLMGVRRSRIKGLGTEFESLREYNEDDYRHIDWKGTARRGKLVVKNFEQERNQALIVCLDVGRHMLAEVEGVHKLDHTLDAALMLMHAAERAGDLVGLLMFNDVIKRYIVPKKGSRQVAAIIDTIHDAQAEPVQPNYTAAFSYLTSRWKRRSLIVLFTDAENEDQARELAGAIGHLKHRHLLMIVRVSDPRLGSLLSRQIETPRDLYSRAATLWYTEDRRKAEAVFRSAGLQTVEADPENLSAALVSAYLRVKETSAL